MNLPTTHFRPPPEREIPAIVRVLPREDVVWNRPTFKAPPLVVLLPSAEEIFGSARAIATPSAR